MLGLIAGIINVITHITAAVVNIVNHSRRLFMSKEQKRQKDEQIRLSHRKVQSSTKAVAMNMAASAEAMAGKEGAPVAKAQVVNAAAPTQATNHWQNNVAHHEDEKGKRKKYNLRRKKGLSKEK